MSVYYLCRSRPTRDNCLLDRFFFVIHNCVGRMSAGSLKVSKKIFLSGEIYFTEQKFREIFSLLRDILIHISLDNKVLNQN